MPGIGGTQRFSKIVGEKKAMRHILTGEGFSAEEAFRMNVAEKIDSQNFNENVDIWLVRFTLLHKKLPPKL